MVAPDVPPVEPVPPAGSCAVLRIGSTWPVSVSNRPNRGFTSTFVMPSCSLNHSSKTAPISFARSWSRTSSNGATSRRTRRITCQPNCVWIGPEISPGCNASVAATKSGSNWDWNCASENEPRLPPCAAEPGSMDSRCAAFAKVSGVTSDAIRSASARSATRMCSTSTVVNCGRFA